MSLLTADIQHFERVRFAWFCKGYLPLRPKNAQKTLYFAGNIKTPNKMKRTTLLLLAVLTALSTCFTSFATSSRGHFQGNVKGSALPGIYWDPHYTADFSLGWRFNEKRFLGLGTGCHWLKRTSSDGPDYSNGFVPAIPLFADYIRYYPFAKHQRNSFYLGMEAGGAYYIKKLPLTTDTQRLFPYLNGKLGFDFGIHNNLGVNVGLNLIWGCQQGFSLTGGGGHGIAMTVGFSF